MKITGSEILKAIESADDKTALELCRHAVANRVQKMTKFALDKKASRSPEVKKLRKALASIDAALECEATPSDRITHALSHEYEL